MFKQSVFLKNIQNLQHKLSDYPRALDILEDMKKNMNRPLKLAIVGEYNAGKSTFINAILGENILPSSNQATTAKATYIQYSPVRGMYITYRDGRHEARALEDLYAFQHSPKKPKKETQIVKAEEIELNEIAQIDLMINNDFLDNLLLIDTPGFNAPDHSQGGKNVDEDTTKEILEDADAIIWLISATQAGKKTEQEKVLSNAKRYKGRSLLVLSKTDMVNEDEGSVQEILNYVRKIFKDNFIEYIALSAQQALSTKTRAANPMAMQVFFNAFYLYIKPMMKEWVITSLEKEMLEFLEIIKNIKKQGMIELQALKNDFVSLYADFERTRKQNSQRVKNAIAQMQNQLDRMLQNTASTMRNHMDYWETQEPYQRRREGFWSDDYFVDYKTTYFYKYTDHIVEKIDQDLSKEFEDQVKSLYQKLYEAFQEYHKGISDKLDEFYQKNQEVLDDHDLEITSNTKTSFFFNPNEDIRVLDINKNYFNGYFDAGLRFGGSYAMNLHTIRMKLSAKPTTYDIIENINYFFPLTSLKNMLDRFREILDETSKDHLDGNIDFLNGYIPSLIEGLQEEFTLFDSCIQDLYR